MTMCIFTYLKHSQCLSNYLRGRRENLWLFGMGDSEGLRYNFGEISEAEIRFKENI